MKREIDLRLIGDTIVLHLRKQQESINVYTLATTLVALADAAKEANSQINPGYSVQVVVETLSDGSFKAKIRAIYKSAENLFSSRALQTIVLAVIANFVYEHTLDPDATVNVTVNTDEVIIEQQNNRIVVPRIVYDAEQRVSHSTRFREKIGQAFESILKDPEIDSVSIDPDETSEKEFPPISKEACEYIALPPKDEDKQVKEEIADLYIIRAILEESRRRWEFSWQGFRIAAPILDAKFYEDFRSHRFTIAPGDVLEARLRIYQTRDPATGIMINDRYEVLEVLECHETPKYIQGEI